MTPESTHRPYGVPAESRPPLGPLAPDLTRATTFAFPTAEDLRAVGSGDQAGEFYPRYGHPAARLFEAQVAEREGADGAVSFASGHAALYAVFCGLLGPGDVLAVSEYVYGGVGAMLVHDVARFGIEVRRFDPFDEASHARALAGGVALVHVETPTNPLVRVLDLERIAGAARRHGALVSVDATLLPPPFQRPVARGADLVVHSATKILGGHSDAHAGVVSGPHALMERLEAFRRRTGAVLGPETAWLLVRSLATLELRTRAASANAERLALALDAIRRRGGPVTRVSYPGLPDHPDHLLARRTMDTFGFMLTFEVAGGLAGAADVFDRFRTVARAGSLGGIETVASLPVHMSHAMVPPGERARAGVTDGLIRLSVGIEPYVTLERRGRRQESVAAFAAEMRAELGLEVALAPDLGAAARASDVIVTCTPSRVPLLGAADVPAGAFVAAVGSDNPAKQELAPALFVGSRLVTDITEQCARVGELHHAIAAGLMTAQDVYGELGEIVAGRTPGRTSDADVIVFDSTGTALQDVAAAAVAYERAAAGARGAPAAFALGD
jgi:methionine-gamma-lyase